MPAPEVFRQYDLSGGVQSATTRLLRKRNEVFSSKNAVFNFKIGGAARRFGYEQVGSTIQYNNDSNGLHAYKGSAGTFLLTAINDANNTQTNINFEDGDGYWKNLTLPVTLDPSTKIQWQDSLDYTFIAGKSSSLNTYMPMLSMDSQRTVSSSLHLTGAPRAKYIAEYQGKLYAMNCQVNGVKYPDRAYQSSAPTGAITFVQGAQTGLLWQLSVNSVRYIKPGMVLDIYTGGTNARQVQSLTVVSVNKENNYFTFAPTQMNLQNNDEIWGNGRKGQLTYYWNTDYPTTETADFLRIPPGRSENPEITGWRLTDSNRLLIFTKSTVMKWDGANLTTISNQVGTYSHETLGNLSGWVIWHHGPTGVWGYNDTFGQLKLLSRSVDNYFKAVNQINWDKASAVTVGRTYKLSVGQIGTLDASTTSTSTSSTSTSSTSSSTSSTSTSSTSTSSTSTSSTTGTTTSTSSTSSSTSSTSTSSTSTSLSTSSTSSSTSTSSTTTTTTTNTRSITRMVYDFDLNIWWPEMHTREIRYQINHSMNGYTKPYFMDDTGKVFRDETGNTDAGDPIPFEVEIGRTNFGTETLKNYLGSYVETENMRGAQVMVSTSGISENPQYQNLATIENSQQRVDFPAKLSTGRDISFKFVHQDVGDRPIIIGVSCFYSELESTYGGAAGRA